MNTALVQVLGAVAYGELKAYEGAKEMAATGDPEQRRRYRKVAAEELRHHKGFVARLEALGADPERAMRPYRRPLDRYHGRSPSDAVDGAVFDYLGEGVADDLLTWLREVTDPETAAFIDTVIADEVEHEANAAVDVREALAGSTMAHVHAVRASHRMVMHMAASGAAGLLPMSAFLRLGRPDLLLRVLLDGYMRRMAAIGLGPLGLPMPRTLIAAWR